MTPKRPEERVGTTVGGRYRIDGLIGKGGMGVVLSGTHTLTGRRVAIKVLLPELAEDADVLARFFQEAKTAASLNHPNVVDTLDMGVEDREPYLVLELLDGESLGQRLDAKKKLPPDELLPIVLPVIDALAAAHEHGIVHRDLKPENVFIALDARGRPVPKVLDFGIAKLVEGETAVATRTGGVLGTPQYMSPEQAMGEHSVGPQSDVWSMGVLLYECLSGRPAFAAPTVAALMMQICSVDPAPLTHWAPEIDPRLAEVVHTAMARAPEERFASMEALGAALIVAATASGIELPAPVEHLFEDAKADAARFAEPRKAPPPPVATGPIPPYPHPGLAVGEGPLEPPVDALAETSVSERPPAPAPAKQRWPLALVGLAVLGAGLGGLWLLREPTIEERTGAAVAAGDARPVPDPHAPAEGLAALPAGVDPPAAPPPPEPAPDPTPTRRLESRPSGAEVWVGGTLLGLTPIDVPIPEGAAVEAELRRAGHRTRRVTLTPGDETESVVLRPRSSGVAGGSELAPR